jgi:ribosomal protein S18 acetylase RimI-like enzyme
MDRIDDLRPGGPPTRPVHLQEFTPCPVPLSRGLYEAVGAAYHWRDRLAWSDEQLSAYLNQATVRVFVARDGSVDLGYFELLRHDDGSVEIAYFGLLPAAFGMGLGRWLLSRATESAFAWGASFVWLHTCTLDAPSALPNYLARGFVPFRSEDYLADVAAPA